MALEREVSEWGVRLTARPFTAGANASLVIKAEIAAHKPGKCRLPGGRLACRTLGMFADVLPYKSLFPKLLPLRQTETTLGLFCR